MKCTANSAHFVLENITPPFCIILSIILALVPILKFFLFLRPKPVLKSFVFILSLMPIGKYFNETFFKLIFFICLNIYFSLIS